MFHLLLIGLGLFFLWASWRMDWWAFAIGIAYIIVGVGTWIVGI